MQASDDGVLEKELATYPMCYRLRCAFPEGLAWQQFAHRETGPPFVELVPQLLRSCTGRVDRPLVSSSEVQNAVRQPSGSVRQFLDCGRLHLQLSLQSQCARCVALSACPLKASSIRTEDPEPS